jgi:hypothetical protein
MICIPLDSPLHSVVPENERGGPVKDLTPCAAESIEDSSIQSTGEGVQSVRGHGIDGNALLGRGACRCVSASSDCVGGPEQVNWARAVGDIYPNCPILQGICR